MLAAVVPVRALWVCACSCACLRVCVCFQRVAKVCVRHLVQSFLCQLSAQPILSHLWLCGMHCLPVSSFPYNFLNIHCHIVPWFYLPKILPFQTGSISSELLRKIIFFCKNIVLQVFEGNFSLLPPNTYLCLLFSRQNSLSCLINSIYDIDLRPSLSQLLSWNSSSASRVLKIMLYTFK